MKKYKLITKALAIFNSDFEESFEGYQLSFINWYSNSTSQDELLQLRNEIKEALNDIGWSWKKASDDANCFFSSSGESIWGF
jgi:hypothetical protein